jgi:DNA-binding NtrC family response regulator
MPKSLAAVLVADDEPSVRESLLHALTELGYRVRCAEGGFSALREIRNEIPELLLSDLNMPHLSGFELLSVVRLRFPAIRTIAMSGSFSGDEVPSGVAADAFYQKGSSMLALVRIMEMLTKLQPNAPQPSSLDAPPRIHRNSPTLALNALRSLRP